MQDILQKPDLSKLQWFENGTATQALIDSRSQPNLFTLVQNWLENIPFVKINYAKFRDSYRESLRKFIQNELDQANVRLYFFFLRVN